MKVPPIIPVTDLRQDAASVLSQVRESNQPFVITQRGRAAAVMLNLDAYEHAERDRELLLRLVKGDMEMATGEGFSLEDVLAEGRKLLDEE